MALTLAELSQWHRKRSNINKCNSPIQEINLKTYTHPGKYVLFNRWSYHSREFKLF